MALSGVFGTLFHSDQPEHPMLDYPGSSCTGVLEASHKPPLSGGPRSWRWQWGGIGEKACPQGAAVGGSIIPFRLGGPGSNPLVSMCSSLRPVRSAHPYTPGGVIVPLGQFAACFFFTILPRGGTWLRWTRPRKRRGGGEHGMILNRLSQWAVMASFRVPTALKGG